MLKIEKKYNPKKEIELLPSTQEKKNKKPDFSIITTPIELSEKLTYIDVLEQIWADVFFKYFSLRGHKISSTSIGGVYIYHGDTITNDGKKPTNINNLIGLFSKNRLYDSKKLKRLGISNSEIYDINIGEKNSHTIRNLFSQKQQEKTIFAEECMNYRSIARQSIVPNEEIDFVMKSRKFYKIKYFVDTKKECMTVNTFSPETIFADVALAVNPIDRRYKKFIGSKVIIPIINKTIPIIGDEQVDMQVDNGIIRITPAHDKLGLEIAIKHKLPTNKFAIDHLGFFSKESGEFSGKKLTDFRDNIIQYLDDICNLGEIQETKSPIAIHKETGEELGQIVSKQWFMKISEESISSIISQYYTTSLNQKKAFFDDEFQKISQICISNHQPFGISMPLRSDKEGKSYTIADDIILQHYKKNGKSKKILLTLIIFNLYADNRIGKRFSLEEILDIMISPNISGTQKTIETYINIYQEYAKENNLPKSFYSEISELYNILKSTEKNNISQLDTLTSYIIKYLEKSHLIDRLDNSDYLLNIKSIYKKELKKQNLTFDHNIVNSILALQDLGYLSTKPPKSNPNFLLFPQDQTMNIIKNILLSKEIAPTFSFKYMFSLNQIDYKEKNKIGFGKKSFIDISSMTENFGGDVARLLLLFSQNNKVSEKSITSYQNLINKLRNAIRFLILKGDQNKRKRHFDKIQKEAEKEKLISIYDQRIIHKIKDFYQDYQDMLTNLDIDNILSKLEDLIRYDFCEKYIEMLKIKKSDNVETYGFFIIGVIAKIIYPFMPFIGQSIRNIALFDGNIQDEIFDPFFVNSQKNYKTQLIIDIIDKVSHIKQKKNRDKNTQIKTCLSTSTDLIDYISHHESIIKKITCTQEIEYKKNLPIENLGYETDSMINISIGVKKLEEKNKIQEKSLADLQEDLSIYNQEIQKLRSIISALSLRNDNESQISIDEKKKELMKLKKKIDRIESEITLFKSKN